MKPITVTEIPVSGSPCAGKTTILNVIPEKLSSYGVRVFTAPEIATMLITGGLQDIGNLSKDKDKNYEIEKHMLLIQIALRERFKSLAESSIFKEEKRVILYDRSEIDIEPYMGREYFEALLECHGTNREKIFSSYKGVLYLVTAAIDAEQYYTLENNKARRETLEEARAIDEKTKKAWEGCNGLKIIDNSTGFEMKVKRALQAVCHMIDIPAPLEIERKFLLRSMPDFSSNSYLKTAQEVSIEQMYLISPNEKEELRIRKRTLGKSSAYYRTHKIKMSSRIRQEKEERISAKEYLDLQVLKNPDSDTIVKSRFCFIYNNQYFELDVFKNPPSLCLLEIELTDVNDKVEIPPFLDVAGEVTDDDRYSNRFLAKK